MKTSDGYKVYLPKCEKCGHYPDPACGCQKCAVIRETNRLKLIAHYKSELASQVPPIKIAGLDVKQVLLIAYFHQTYQGHNKSNLISEEEGIAPSKKTIVDNFKKANLLNVSPDSIERCIEMTSTTDHIFHQDKLTYQLAGSDDPDWIQLVRVMTRGLFRSSQDDVIRLWGELAIKEAIHYYAKLCLSHSIPFNNSPNVLANIKRGVVELGLFKTISAILLSVRRATSKRKEEHITAKHAANYAQYRFNWWLDNPKELKPARRHDEYFPEPKIVNIFIKYFLPFSIEYGLMELRQFADVSVTEEEA